MQRSEILGKGLLFVSATVFVGYGLFGFFNPEIPADFGGLVIANGNGFAEIGAMYGGLQTGIGIFCLISALKSDYYRAGLMLLAVAIGSLALGRLYGAIMTTDTLTGYTYGALAYEALTAALAAIALQLHKTS